MPHELIRLNVSAGNPSYPEFWKGPQNTKVNLIEDSLSLCNSVELSKPMGNYIKGKTKSMYEQPVYIQSHLPAHYTGVKILNYIQVIHTGLYSQSQFMYRTWENKGNAIPQRYHASWAEKHHGQQNPVSWIWHEGPTHYASMAKKTLEFPIWDSKIPRPPIPVKGGSFPPHVYHGGQPLCLIAHGRGTRGRCDRPLKRYRRAPERQGQGAVGPGSLLGSCPCWELAYLFPQSLHLDPKQSHNSHCSPLTGEPSLLESP